MLSRRLLVSASPTYVVGAFVLLMVSYHLIFGKFFPLPNGLMGSDYSLGIAGATDGYLWFRQNGFLTPPWFSPSFCGGQALFADPQTGFYSIPQFFAFVIDPVSAIYASFLLFAALGFWGTYVLGRRTFSLSVTAALVAATLFMFNGFYSHRMIVGHAGYEPFMLVPWLAWLLCEPSGNGKPRARWWLLTLSAGVLLALWLHGGLTTLIIPAGLGVLALACVADLRTPGTLQQVLLRGTTAALIALVLCASKLVANVILMSHFERTYYPLPGIADPVGLFKFVVDALFYSSQHAFDTVTPLWRNMQWIAMPHETAFGLTFIPLALILVGVLLKVSQLRRVPRPRLIPLLLLLAIVALPFALLYYSPGWNEVLKRIPIFGSTTAPARWLIILIPLIALVAAVTVDLPRVPKLTGLVLVLCVPALNALENREYYESQNYDPKPALDFYAAVKAGTVQPGIDRIEDPVDTNGNHVANNLAFTHGASAIYCYNPLFGYRLEKYHPAPLEAGPIEKVVTPGHFNLRNPACLLYPEENACSPWDTFTTDQREHMRRFAHYQAFPFQISRTQQLANWLTEAALVATLLAYIGLGLALARMGPGP